MHLSHSFLNILLLALGANVVNAVYYCSNSGVCIFQGSLSLSLSLSLSIPISLDLFSQKLLLTQPSIQDQTAYCRKKCAGGSIYINCSKSYVRRVVFFLANSMAVYYYDVNVIQGRNWCFSSISARKIILSLSANVFANVHMEAKVEEVLFRG